MCDFTKNFYIYTSCIDPGTHFFGTSDTALSAVVDSIPICPLDDRNLQPNLHVEESPYANTTRLKIPYALEF
ncbi:uncharacterized protein DNG_00674 [Cephalotrichum gorgonifer]|uniref:Uncharacterized protein n=1 Tax=Cephalotrichum gorgonifer TaxID=2041049 RepID=A0AAE8MPQ6_9PEZI|nr:uncharacterized protein DNG_00674 [Cephalotrichum gorgonifer]